MPTPFAPNSRYFNQVEGQATAADGSAIPYLTRRLIPAPDRFTAFDRVAVAADERVDALAAAGYGDPLQYWRICDANAVEDPGAACKDTGRRLILPLPLEVGSNGQS